MANSWSGQEMYKISLDHLNKTKQQEVLNITKVMSQVLRNQVEEAPTGPSVKDVII